MAHAPWLSSRSAAARESVQPDCPEALPCVVALPAVGIGCALAIVAACRAVLWLSGGTSALQAVRHRPVHPVAEPGRGLLSGREAVGTRAAELCLTPGMQKAEPQLSGFAQTADSPSSTG